MSNITLNTFVLIGETNLCKNKKAGSEAGLSAKFKTKFISFNA